MQILNNESLLGEKQDTCSFITDSDLMSFSKRLPLVFCCYFNRCAYINNFLKISMIPENTIALVAFNFSEANQNIHVTFDIGGDFIEQLHNEDHAMNVFPGESRTLTIPSNYGRVWLKS